MFDIPFLAGFRDRLINRRLINAMFTKTIDEFFDIQLPFQSC
ncbi:hypothetical protein D1AOALGA4SA_11893 [Olavius algarvensis Delta 1 endosymbiont]|nr:hypothetical protein D1AOALGA4SA_11893 [Olavius algarvensis Delta 1 endosymbiont]